MASEYKPINFGDETLERLQRAVADAFQRCVAPIQSRDAVPLAGAVLYFNGRDWIALSPGNPGERLTSQGPGLPPRWAP